MKRLITVALMLGALTAVGQELKKVVKKHSSNPFTNEREEYEVLSDDKKVRHGLYKKWVNDKLTEEGYYKNNKKDSIWTRYSGQTILNIGNYANDEKVGIWEYYINAIELEQEYDFTKKALVSFKPPRKNIIYQIINDKDTLFAPLSRPPLIIGGQYAYLEKVAKNLRYPIEAMRNNISGTVFVRFMIDETGKTSDFKVVNTRNKSLDREALRVVKLIDDWLPAIKDGKPVKVIHVVPIIFAKDGIVNR
ncbi:energy transducer TonB [Emticicia sp. BO119]|uniref:energy transducer TonB n=1 Tax=Emticicia sp. BO119 TaxID=2757768 RepID=UPI0015F07D48|nr:energy transducer TonB [Emticicia sp. BO119]MBA4848749.1 TonB family protein [Emticicia sp. BO119]